MAKGDRKAAQTSIDYGSSQSQNQWNNMMNRVQPTQGLMSNMYGQAAPQALPDYNSIRQNYNTFMNPGAAQAPALANRAGQAPGQASGVSQWLTGDPTRDPLRQQAYQYITQAGGTPTGRGTGPTDLEYYVDQMLDPVNAGYGDWAGRVQRGIQGTQPGGGSFTGGGTHTGDPFYDAINKALGGYSNFAETGGFSPEDIQNIRARMIAPIRSVFSSANADIDKQRRLQHGFSPNYTAAKAKTARDLAYSTADATTNAEAAIAQLLQQGRLAGAGGLASTGAGARGQNLQAIGGMGSLFGTSPGLAQTFGNQLLGANAQDINMQNLQQQINDSRMAAQLGAARVPSDASQFFQNVGSGLGLIGQGAAALSPFGSMFPRNMAGSVGGNSASTIWDPMYGIAPANR